MLKILEIIIAALALLLDFFKVAHELQLFQKIKEYINSKRKSVEKK